MELTKWLTGRAGLQGLVGFVFLLFANTGCAGTLQGQVLDAQTGQPIAGAVVLGVWTKLAGLPGLHHHELVGVREVETDTEGRFVLEQARRVVYEDDESVTVYKPGYVAWSNLYIFPTSERRTDTRIPAEIRLEPFPPDQSHSQHMSFINNSRRAGRYGIDSMPKFWSALQPELRMQ